MTATKTTRMSPMRKHRALAGLAVLLLAAGLTGCATYVEVNSDPEGALITDRAGRSHGTAPVSKPPGAKSPGSSRRGPPARAPRRRCPSSSRTFSTG